MGRVPSVSLENSVWSRHRGWPGVPTMAGEGRGKKIAIDLSITGVLGRSPHLSPNFGQGIVAESEMFRPARENCASGFFVAGRDASLGGTFRLF